MGLCAAQTPTAHLQTSALVKKTRFLGGEISLGSPCIAVLVLLARTFLNNVNMSSPLNLLAHVSTVTTESHFFPRFEDRTSFVIFACTVLCGQYFTQRRIYFSVWIFFFHLPFSSQTSPSSETPLSTCVITSFSFPLPLPSLSICQSVTNDQIVRR